MFGISSFGQYSFSGYTDQPVNLEGVQATISLGNIASIEANADVTVSTNVNTISIGDLTFVGAANVTVSGNGLTSSLGSATHVWKDLFVSEESLKFVSSSGTITSLKQSEVRRLKEGKSIRTGLKDLKGSDGTSNDIIVTRGIFSHNDDDTFIKFGTDIMGCVLSGSMFFEIQKTNSNNRVTMGNGTTDLQLKGNINEATLDGGTF